MSKLSEIIERNYRKYGKKLPVKKQENPDKQVIERGWQTCKERLMSQDIYELFDGMIKRWIESGSTPHIQTVSDLKHYGELVSYDGYTRVSELKKLMGKFNLTAQICEEDANKSYAVLESPDLRRAFIYKNSMRFKPVGQVMEAMV